MRFVCVCDVLAVPQCARPTVSSDDEIDEVEEAGDADAGKKTASKSFAFKFQKALAGKRFAPSLARHAHRLTISRRCSVKSKGVAKAFIDEVSGTVVASFACF